MKTRTVIDVYEEIREHANTCQCGNPEAHVHEWSVRARYTPARPAVIHAPAERCHPAEDAEVDRLTFHMGGIALNRDQAVARFGDGEVDLVVEKLLLDAIEADSEGGGVAPWEAA